MRTITALLALTLAACHGGTADPHGGGHRAATARAHQPILTEAAIAMPIAPGKTEAWTAALRDLTGARYQEYDASRRRFGLTAQTTFVQRTPMGDLALIHLTGADVHASFHQMSTSQDPWDVQWRALTKDLHGVDFGAGARVLPHVEAAYAMGDPASTAPEFLFAAPLGHDGAAALRALAVTLMGDRHDEYARARRAIGVEREAVFLETTALGDVAVFHWRARDPQASLRALATSTRAFDAWLRDQAARAHPVGLETLTELASANVMVGQYPHP